MEYEKILELTDSNEIRLGKSFKDEINKKLCLGMSAYAVKHGSLSDGHEKITNADRYYQSIKEMYNYANSAESYRIQAMLSQADLLDAEEMPEETTQQKLRKQAAILKAKNALTNSLVSIEDLTRQINAFNEVRLELMNEVESKYPLGIEQAEEDNWTAKAKYKMLKNKFGFTENLTHLPLRKELKAKLGLENNAPEMAAWLSVTDPNRLEALINETKAISDKRTNK